MNDEANLRRAEDEESGDTRKIATEALLRNHDARTADADLEADARGLEHASTILSSQGDVDINAALSALTLSQQERFFADAASGIGIKEWDAWWDASDSDYNRAVVYATQPKVVDVSPQSSDNPMNDDVARCLPPYMAFAVGRKARASVPSTLSYLSAAQPSPHLCFHALTAAFAYAVMARRYNGGHLCDGSAAYDASIFFSGCTAGVVLIRCAPSNASAFVMTSATCSIDAFGIAASRMLALLDGVQYAPNHASIILRAVADGIALFSSPEKLSDAMLDVRHMLMAACHVLGNGAKKQILRRARRAAKKMEYFACWSKTASVVTLQAVAEKARACLVEKEQGQSLGGKISAFAIE